MTDPALAPAVRVVGREAQLRRLTAVVLGAFRGGSDAVDPAAYLVTGEAGVGKSVLLATVSGRAAAAGAQVLSLTGRPQTSLTPFDGLRLLLRPLDRLTREVAGAPGDALRAVLADAPVPTPTERALVPAGVLALLAAAATTSPVLVGVDELGLLDPGSRDVLTAVAAGLAGARLARVAVVAAERGPVDVSPGWEVVELGPLDEAEALELLDHLPDPPVGRDRLDVLRCARGNPLALVELSRLAAAGRFDTRPGDGALPLTSALLAAFGQDVETLPEPTRAALLYAAAGEDRLHVLESTTVEVDPMAWTAAETAEVVTVAGGRVRFRHPLLQSAVLQTASPAARSRAHAALAAALRDEPGRRAWHLSAASGDAPDDTPDDEVGAELAAYAETVAARGDARGAATLLERAARVTAAPGDRARRLIRAAELAGTVGQVAWVLDLVDAATAASEESEVQVQAAALGGWALVMADRAPTAVDRLLGVAGRHRDRGVTRAAPLVFTAALPTWSIGSDAATDRFRAATDRVLRTEFGTTDPVALPTPALFPLAVGAPDDDLLAEVRARARPGGALRSADEVLSAATLGAAAYVLDETRTAIEQLTPVVDTLRRGVGFSPTMTAFAALGWSLLDAGRFRAAAANVVETERRNAVPDLPVMRAVAAVQAAVVAGSTGSRADLAAALGRATAAVGPGDHPALAAHLAVLHARVAAADGEHRAALDHLLTLFDLDGRPRHRPLASLALGDLAAAARRVGEPDRARHVLAATTGGARWRSHRQELVEARAWAVLEDDPDHRAAALARVAADPAAPNWPLEHALTLLDLADAHRRVRRDADAREALLAATDVFERLGAAAFEARGRAELRAVGLRVAPDPTGPAVALTEQQRQIVALAASGLTNREIGAALFLSPRTVASHLYRAFPKLGITSRAQLGDAHTPTEEDHGAAG